MMQSSHHPLIDEFSARKERIHNLKLNYAHFRRMTQDYEDVDKSIVRAEQGIETVCDEYLEEIKKQRLNLKDLIYAMLKNP